MITKLFIKSALVKTWIDGMEFSTKYLLLIPIISSSQNWLIKPVVSVGGREILATIFCELLKHSRFALIFQNKSDW